MGCCQLQKNVPYLHILCPHLHGDILGSNLELFEEWIKNSYDAIISTVEKFLDQWEMCADYKGVILKNITHLVTFYESILVSL